MRDKINGDNLRVEASDDGGCAVAVFSGPHAREGAIVFVRACYGSYGILDALPEPAGASRQWMRRDGGVQQ